MSEVNWNLLAGIGKSYNDAFTAAQKTARENELYDALSGLSAKARDGSLTVGDVMPVLARTNPGALAPLLLQQQQMKNDAGLLKSPEMTGGAPQADAGQGGGASSDPVSKDLAPHQVALLNGIAGPESSGRYNIRYTPGGGTTFNSYTQHPAIFEPGPDGPSSAAGRYQFTKSTWDAVMGPDALFTPENQDRAALKLAQQDYAKRTGRDLDADLQANGLTPQIMQVLAPTWAGLRDNPQKAASAFQGTLARMKGGASQPVQVADNSGRTVPQARPQAGAEDGEGEDTPAGANAAPGASQPLVTIPSQAQQLEAAAAKLEAQAGNAAYSESARAAATARAKALRDRAKLFIEAANRAPDTATVSKTSRLINTRTGQEIAAQGGQEAVDQEELAKERAKVQSKAEGEQLHRGEVAQAMQPVIDRALSAYDKLKELDAIGPVLGSGPARTVAALRHTSEEALRQEYESALKELELYKAQTSMKGQGAITESERRLLNMTFPPLTAVDAEKAVTPLRTLKTQMAQDAAALKGNPLAGPTTITPRQQTAPDAGWVDVGGGIRVRRK